MLRNQHSRFAALKKMQPEPLVAASSKLRQKGLLVNVF